MTNPSRPFIIWIRGTPGLLSKRLRLLKKVRSSAVEMANSADLHHDYVAVDRAPFDQLIQAINRLMKFEERHGA